MNSSPSSRRAGAGGTATSAALRSHDATRETAEFFDELAALFGRWGEFSELQKLEIVQLFADVVVPHLPPEMACELERFLERRAEEDCE